MARKQQDQRFEWSREARRVQPLFNGVRIFDHTGHGHVVPDRLESVPVVDALLARITDADPGCADRITLELAAWANS